MQVAVDFFVALHEFGAAGEGGAALGRRQGRKQKGGQFFEAIQNAIQLRRSEFLGARHGGDISPQFLEPVIADRHAEILPGHILDFVRFIEHHRMIFRQDAAFGVAILQHLFQGQVGKEQVMVDDDDVARLRPLVHQRQEAALELFALLAGAKVAARVDFGPRGRRFGQLLDLRAVADFSGVLPGLDDLEIGHFFQTGEYRLVVGIVDLLPAGVVVAALHVTHTQGACEVLLEKRNVFEKELLLQILGARGDHDALAGEDGGDQVGQRFAGARTGFHDQMLAVLERRGHRFGHGQLAGPVFIIRMPFGKCAVPPEELMHVGNGFDIGGHAGVNSIVA